MAKINLIPRLTIREQLSQDLSFRRETKRLSAIEESFRKGSDPMIKKAADYFNISGEFVPQISKKDLRVFTPKGLELMLENLIGKTAEEIDNMAAGIDAALQVSPISIAEEIEKEMITIPAGKFIFQGQKGVRHDGFKIANTPFRNGQFRELYEMRPNELWKIITNPMRLLNSSLKISAEDEEDIEDKENSPLVFVSQPQAIKIAELLGMRLLTELEWERAATYTDGRRLPWGNVFDATKLTFGDKGTRSVFKHREGASPEKILDLLGNISEWTSTPYGKIEEIDFFTDAANPVFPRKSKYYSVRGGSWKLYSSRWENATTNDNIKKLTHRQYYEPECRYDDLGFRLAMDLK